MIGFNKGMPFIGFLAAFYLVDVARLYVEHEWFIEIDRLFTWVAPTMLFILLWEKKNPIIYLKLQGNVAKGIFVGLLVGAIQGVLHLGFNYVFKGQVNFNFHLGYRVWWNVIITAGFVEEIVSAALFYRRFGADRAFGQPTLLVHFCLP